MDGKKLTTNLKRSLDYLDKYGKAGHIRTIADVQELMSLIHDVVRKYKDISTSMARKFTTQDYEKPVAESLSEHDIKTILRLLKEEEEAEKEAEKVEPEPEPAKDVDDKGSEEEEEVIEPGVALKRLMNSSGGSSFMDALVRMTPQKKADTYINLLKSLPDINSTVVNRRLKQFFTSVKK